MTVSSTVITDIGTETVQKDMRSHGTCWCAASLGFSSTMCRVGAKEEKEEIPAATEADWADLFVQYFATSAIL